MSTNGAKQAEQRRLELTRSGEADWKRWGPYLSERQWGTVREDHSENGNAWDYLTHDQARSRAYRWGEDGLAGISDPLAMVDPEFAKSQLDLMLRNDYLHPNGQMPAYEWNFGDVNPSVHAYATMQIYLMDRERNHGNGDLKFLGYAFSKLL